MSKYLLTRSSPTGLLHMYKVFRHLKCAICGWLVYVKKCIKFQILVGNISTHIIKKFHSNWLIVASAKASNVIWGHGLRTPREERAFTARPKIQSQSQIFRYNGSIFCLPHRPNFSDIFDLCLHWMSVVRALLVKEGVFRLYLMHKLICLKSSLFASAKWL